MCINKCPTQIIFLSLHDKYETRINVELNNLNINLPLAQAAINRPISRFIDQN